MLPGQGALVSAPIASLGIETKKLTSSGMPSSRSRSGGISTGNTSACRTGPPGTDYLSSSPQIAVRSGDQSPIDLNGIRTAQPLELVFLESAQLVSAAARDGWILESGIPSSDRMLAVTTSRRGTKLKYSAKAPQ